MRPATLSLFLGAWLAFLPFHPGRPLTVDSVVTLDTVRALARGSLAVPKTLVTRPGRDGNHYSLYGPLLPLLSLPGYKLAAWLEGASNEPGNTCITWADDVALGTNQWISALIVALVFEVALRWGAPLFWALGVSIAAATSTMILPYSRDYFTQPLAALCVLSSFLSLRHSVSTGSRFALALSSLMMGAAVLTRMDMLALLPGFLLSALRVFESPHRGSIPNLIGSLTAPLLVCLLGLLVFDWYRWGGWFATPYQRMPFRTPLIDSLPRFLYGQDLGIFLHNPLLLPSLCFLCLTWRECGWLWRGVLLSDLCYLVLVASYVDYHGGICPGPRYLLALVPLNLLPLLMGLGKPSFRKPAVGAALAICAVAGLMMNGYAALVDYTQAPPAWDFWRSRSPG